MNNFREEVINHPEKFCVQVVNKTGSHHFESFETAKANYTSLDIEKNTKDFTWAAYNGVCEYHQKPQMRFEDWETNEILSH
jgi:hypothetical protein